MLTSSSGKGRVRVIDFGSGSVDTASGQHQFAYIQSRFYRAPEVLVGAGFTRAVDVWSLGCVLAELVLGRPLFPSHSSFDQVGCLLAFVYVNSLSLSCTRFARHWVRCRRILCSPALMRRG